VRARDSEVIWHDVECGAYEADLPLWEELAAEAGAPILDLGCGTGRVMRDLRPRGHEVLGLDINPEFVAASGNAVAGDARRFELDERFGLVIAPMQLVQLFEGSDQRLDCLRSVERHLVDDGLAAFAIVDSVPAPINGAAPLPDTREVDGWVYSSLPIETVTGDGAIRVRRLRQAVSPAGELSEAVDEVVLRELDAATLEGEAAEAGLRAGGRRSIPATDAHIGSTVVLLGREG
jgi:SAM-dependent methyltransferase